MRGAKGNRLVQQHDGHHVLQANIGDVAVIDDTRRRAAQANDHALDLRRFEGVFLPDGLDRIQWPLDR